MKDEASPVSPDELVLRLIWQEFYVPGRPVPVRDRAFMPRANEREGISVFRLACLHHPEDVLAVIAPEKRGKYAIAAIPVVELTALGLTVQPAKIETVPGHAVLPELNTDAVAADDQRWAAVREQLAKVASRNLIRHPTPPTGEESAESHR
jgi:hypothetical protein